MTRDFSNTNYVSYLIAASFPKAQTSIVKNVIQINTELSREGRKNFGQDKQFTCIVTLMRFPATILAVEEKLVLRTLSVFVALGIRQAMRMSHVAIFGHAHMYNIFPHCLIKDKIFKKKKKLYKI